MSVDDETAGRRPPKKLSRSALLAGGGAAAASLALGRTGPADAASWSAAADDLHLGLASEHENAIELVFKIDQVGALFTTYDVLLTAAGTPDPGGGD